MSKHFLAGYALIVLRRDNHVLFVKRSASAPFGADCYSLIGGRVEKDETFRQALVRETMEEVGVSIDPTDLHFVHAFYREGAESPLVALVFECTRWSGEPFNKEPQKHSAMSWFSLDDLPQNMLPAHRGALELIKQKVFYSEQRPSQ